MWFSFVVVNTKNINTKKMGQRLQLDSMCQLISRSIRLNKDLQERVVPDQLHILFDNFAESQQSRDEGWRIRAKEKIEHDLKESVEHMQPCDSKIVSLLQIVDLFTGLIGCIRNSKPIFGNKSSLSDLLCDCRHSIWRWQPSDV